MEATCRAASPDMMVVQVKSLAAASVLNPAVKHCSTSATLDLQVGLMSGVELTQAIAAETSDGTAPEILG